MGKETIEYIDKKTDEIEDILKEKTNKSFGEGFAIILLLTSRFMGTFLENCSAENLKNQLSTEKEKFILNKIQEAHQLRNDIQALFLAICNTLDKETNNEQRNN